MPPKVKISKDAIVQAALDIVRRDGADALNVRAVAGALGCSTQPVFSNFRTVDALRRAVADAVEALYTDYQQADIAAGQYPAYKASGMSYIRFAREEKELFKLLYMRDRSAEEPDGIEKLRPFLFHLQEELHIGEEEALRFHLEMWAVVHGIAAMSATGYLTLEPELVSAMLTDIYRGLVDSHTRSEG